ncbi:DNA mismatch repair endonuclease MutL [Eubacterium coprostanoligenes]|uniref:DNA mismatch repair endonuclease MutL n=1 Tax=Eubacterium coprostanoligenes TaxID=290054 RepID=UPI00235534F6|nr:DNA mismatch repair endonuclease MutL [Eubacterium coprostanoligenes]MCI6254376.1 DNA mismatch repair endonuclease MutL [Eubacterium coprostanoligenes]MDY5400543.1 DNA mismatch repair endonuclease MutL [Eubacterium coprostanoligenes]
MPQINILPKEVYQLIAAGEVVERPSSVVKEMIENSVDAGAKNITVEIKNGGSTYIRITDDGCGIARSEVKKVFISHATSKIKVSDDLDKIGTLGFRGEAMASISAVAKVQLLTRTPDEEIGTRYEIAGGQELDFSDAGCPVGTTIVVADIFFNTPARMKFLKKDVTEANAVAGVVERIAVSHPEISFRFIRDGKQTLITSGNGDLKSTIYSVFGREFANSLIPVDYEINNMHVSGFVTKPSMSRKSRGMQFFFINSRLVKSQTAMAALEQAYRNSIMVGRFPGCVLNIECNSSFVDVNVHPAKIEVRFANEKPVFELVYYGVKNAIEMLDTPKEAHFSAPRPTQTTVNGKIDFFKPKEEVPTQMQFKQESNPDDFWRVASPDVVRDKSPKSEEAQNYVEESTTTAKLDLSKFTKPATSNEQQANNESETQEQTKPLPKQEKAESVEVPDFRLVGEIFKTYIIIEMDGDCYMIDKHAAHERMNFEALKASIEIASQVLLSPVAVRLSREEYNAVLSNLDLYSKCGFAIEDFGNSTVLVRECPSILDGEDVSGLVEETASKLLDGKTDITPEQMDWIFHSASCRAAVKAGDKTSPYEMELFVKKLLANPNIRYCPHGRPVMIKLSKYDIEKQFGRIQ